MNIINWGLLHHVAIPTDGGAAGLQSMTRGHQVSRVEAADDLIANTGCGPVERRIEGRK